MSKFSLGQVVATKGAFAEIPYDEIMKALARHSDCDWGDMCDEDKITNDDALQNGGRLFSSYHSKTGRKFWIITEHDRSYTTVLLPEEY